MVFFCLFIYIVKAVNTFSEAAVGDTKRVVIFREGLSDYMGTWFWSYRPGKVIESCREGSFVEAYVSAIDDGFGR